MEERGGNGRCADDLHRQAARGRTGDVRQDRDIIELIRHQRAEHEVGSLNLKLNVADPEALFFEEPAFRREAIGERGPGGSAGPADLQDPRFGGAGKWCGEQNETSAMTALTNLGSMEGMTN